MSDTPVPQDEPAHSLIGASSMGRLIACPASFNLSQQVRDAAIAAYGTAGSNGSIYAATGTVAHALGEEAITLGYDPASQLGEVVIVDGHEVTVDESMIDAVRVYVDEVRRIVSGASWHAIEVRVCLDSYWQDHEKPPVSAFGTGDTIAYSAPRQHMDVVDYKNGAGVFVDVVNNPQLNFYAAGALLEVPGPVVTVDLTIVQPNVRGREKIRVAHTTALDILIWVDDILKPTIAEAMQPGARITAGAHCRFCPARSACPALAAVAQDLARRDFGPSFDAPVILSEEELGHVLADMDLVEVHVDALREVAQAKIEQGVPVPGWALVPSRPVRGWASKGPVIEAVVPENVRAKLYAPLALRTPAQLEKLLTPEEWALVQPFVQSKSSGVRLVPDAAQGGTARNAPQDDFA